MNSAHPSARYQSFRVIRLWSFVAFCLPLGLFAHGGRAALGEDLPTVAEASEYKATSKSIEVEQFIESCAALGEHLTRFQFGTTVEGRPMTCVAVANPAYDPNDPDDRVVVLLLGNIHSGECAGKEALLRMMRELARDPEHPWLEDVVVLFAPNYNADGNDRIDTGNRPGQVGPELGMGQRPNAQRLDLNRDFMKLESPEAQSLVKLVAQFEPHVFIDCHTTNGSRHRYSLTYDIPHNPTAPKSTVTLLREKMMPAVTAAVAEKDQQMFYYGNFNRDRTRWTTYGHEPRYSTEYFGLRGKLGILSEAYSYISYRERIQATHDFVSACLDFCAANGDEIRSAVESAETQMTAAQNWGESNAEARLLSLQAEVAPFDEPVSILGYDGEAEADYEVEFFGRYVPIRQTQIPAAYMLDAAYEPHIQKLLQHGIQVERLSEEVELDVERVRVDDFRTSTREFQGHRMARLVGTRETEQIALPAGTFVVRCNQPLGRLVAYLLDPESNDGLTTWNFFDSDIEEGEFHPVMSIGQPREMPLTDYAADASE